MSRSRPFVLLLAAACLVAVPAAAQVVAPGYVHDAWTNADGLPVNTVNAIVQDADGYLWLATFDGLIRFDGHTFTVFNTANTPGLPSNRISQLFRDHDGRLWFSSGDGAVAYWHRGRVTALDPGVIGQAHMQGLARAADGTIWLNATGGIFRVEGGRPVLFWRDPEVAYSTLVFPVRDGSVWVVPNSASAAAIRVSPHDTTRFGLEQLGEVADVYEEPQAPGEVCISTAKGAFHYARGAGRWIAALPGLKRCFRDAAGQRYLGTTSRLYRTGPGGPAPIFEGPQQEYVFDPYWSVLQAGPGQTWVAGPDRLLHNERLVFLLDEPQTQIRQILADREGNLWIATLRRGLHRLRPSLFTTYGVPEGLGSANVYAVREAPAGTLWFGTMGGGLARLQGGSVRVWRRAEGVPNQMYDLLPGRRGGLWAAGGMLAYSASRDAPTFEAEYTRRLGIDEPVSDLRALYEDRRGCLWIGSAAVLYRTCDGRLDRFTTADGLPANAVRAFLETRDGTLYMATTGGVAAYREGRFDALTTAGGLSSNNVRALYEDAGGVLWVGTEDRGLNRVVRRADDPAGAARITVYRQADGLFDDGIHTILEDDFGRFWMSTNRGLFWVDRDDLAAFAEGRRRRIFSVGYDESDGLRDREANGGTQSPGVKASDGRLWFATQGGAVVVDPADVRPDVVARVPTYVEAVEADTFAVAGPAGEVRLPRGVRAFDVRYTGIHFTKPQSVRFRYRLGADEPWTEAGARRTAIFTNVAPGTYTFEVVASAYPGQWPERGATLTVVVPRFFYETAWFQTLAALLLAAALGAGYSARVRRLRRQADALNALVAARTADADAQRREAVRQQGIAEEALGQVRAQAEQLRALDAAKSRFFANISHEFRTPLTLTLGPLEDLRDGAAGPLGDEALAQVRLAHRNAQRLLRLINQLLDLSRLESGTVRLDRRPVDLKALLAGVAGAFVALAERKAITFAVDLPDAPVYTEGDAVRLDEVFVNLLGNAFKFTPDGGRITVRLEPGPDACRVVVADTGVGIAPEDLPRVFERFYQGRRGQSPSTPGTGIGLALSHELVALHGGEIAVASTPGEGSTFEVALPILDFGFWILDCGDADTTGEASAHPDTEAPGDGLAMPAALPPGSKIQNSESKIPRSDRTTVLVVDDHPDIRAYVRRHLEPAYAVLEAEDGAAGLELARTHLPDLVVSDVMMPEMDGFDLVRALRADPALGFIAVILLTGRAAAEDRLAGLGEGADDYLTKPFDVRELRVRVDNLIRQRQRLRALVQHAPPPADPTGPPSADEAFVERVQAAVLARLADETLNVDVLAADVGLSRSQLHRRLTAVAGQTPTDFIRSVRLAEAARLLAHRTGTVSEVAYGVGFNSVAHFSRAFRAAYGVAPSAYAPQAGPAKRVA